MEHVYILEHTYELESSEETKFIGVYSSVEKANEAIERLKVQPGFCAHPDGFSINKCTIDRDGWTEGFITVVGINILLGAAEVTCVEAKQLGDGNYQILDKVQANTGNFRQYDVVRGEVKNGELCAVELIKRSEK